MDDCSTTPLNKKKFQRNLLIEILKPGVSFALSFLISKKYLEMVYFALGDGI